MSATALTTLIARCRRLCRPCMQDTDAALLRRFTHQRDTDAFEELLERHAPLVWGICRRLVANDADAEDAFQATFLALVRRADALDATPSLAAWLHTVAVRLAGKVQARTRRQRTQARLPESATSGDVADEVGSRELCRLVDKEMERLPALLRAPLILCCLQGRTRDEAAETLGCSVAAIKSRLERGREQLRRRLERRGVELPLAFLVVGLTGERIRAALWAKTMQTVLYTPLAALVALAEAAIPAFAVGKGKLAALLLLFVMGTAGALGHALRPQPQPQALPTLPAKGVAVTKKPQPPQVRTDRYGDPLPDGAIARLGTVRWRHGPFVHALAYSRDGKRIATTGIGRALVLWDAETGKEIRSFPSRGQPQSVAFSPDGKLIATNQRFGQLWHVATGKMREVKNAKLAVSYITFSLDGKCVATANSDNALHIWDTAGGEEKRRIDCVQGEMHLIAYSPDGSLLASGGSDGTIRLWLAETGKERKKIVVGKKEVFSFVFSPDGKRLAVTCDGEPMRLWDVKTGKEARAFDCKPAFSAPLSYSPDGTLLAVGNADGSIGLWDTANGKETRHWSAGTWRIRAIAFSPDGKTLATSVIWGGGLCLWDVTTGSERFPSEGHRGPIPLLRFEDDNKTLISGGFDRSLLWWDVATQKPRRRFTWMNEGSFLTLDLSPDGKHFLIADRKTQEVILWDIETEKSQRVAGNVGEDPVATFSPDGRTLAFGGKGKGIHLWDMHQGKETRQIQGEVGLKLRFAPDGKTLAGSSPLRLWDTASGKMRCDFNGQAGQDCPLAFSPDGKILASATNLPAQREGQLVRLWDTATGRLVGRYAGNPSGAYAAAFSPDGKLIASSGGMDEYNPVHLWEAASGRLIRRFEGHYGWLWALAFASDGLTLASSAGDSTILLWDFTGRRPDGRWHSKPLTPRQLETCWTDLANEDAAKAYDAVWALVAAPEQAVPFLKTHLPPASRPNAQTIARFIADLDSDNFTVRQKATEELGKCGDTVAPALRQALDDKPTLEMRRRIQQLLEQSSAWTAERLRVHRAIQALEHMNSRSAQEWLQALAEGAPLAQRTEEAKAALRRLAKRSRSLP